MAYYARAPPKNRILQTLFVTKIKIERRCPAIRKTTKLCIHASWFCRWFCSKSDKTLDLKNRVTTFMTFFNSAVNVLQTLVIALGAGLGVWGVINLLEGYGNDNPGAKSQGMKQLMAGGGVALIGLLLVPQLGSLFG